MIAYESFSFMPELGTYSKFFHVSGDAMPLHEVFSLWRDHFVESLVIFDKKIILAGKIWFSFIFFLVKQATLNIKQASSTVRYNRNLIICEKLIPFIDKLSGLALYEHYKAQWTYN